MLPLKNITLLIFLFTTCLLQAQTEVIIDSASSIESRKLPTLQKSSLLKNASPENHLQNQPSISEYLPTNTNLSKSSALPKYKNWSVNYFPEQLSRERLSTHFPFADDYAHSGTQILNQNSWLSGATEHKTLPTFGIIQQSSFQYNRIFDNRLIVSGGLSGQKLEMHEQQYGDLKATIGTNWLINDRMNLEASADYSLMRRDGGQGSMMASFIPSEISGGRTSELMPTAQAQTMLNYRMTNWLLLSGGTYINRNNLFGQNITDYGLNSRMNIRVTDRLSLKMHGTYSLKGQQSLVTQTGNPMFYPENNYGGAIEYRISDKFGIGAGVDRELNPFTGKWVTKPYVYPIFYNDKGEDNKSFQIQINGR